MKITACGLALLLVASTGRADEVKLNGLWVRDVQFTFLRGDRLGLQTAAGAEVVKPLNEVEGARFADYPQYAQAMEALEAGDASGAVKLLRETAPRARTAWGRAYVAAALWRACARAGDAPAAVKAYLELAAAGVDPYFLADPPVQVIAEASDTVRATIADQLRTALPRAVEPVKAHLQAMLTAASAPSAAPHFHAGLRQPSVDTAPVPTRSTVILPIRMSDSAAVKLLRAGKFAEARTHIEADLQREGDTAVDLYLLGVAQLYEADGTGDTDGYKDAGLSFMRVLVYFPRSNFAGRNLVAGSLIELGYIHDKLGRAEKAKELYDRAAAAIDESSDPNLHHRLQQLRDASR